jgi:hypothetical protein
MTRAQRQAGAAALYRAELERQLHSLTRRTFPARLPGFRLASASPEISTLARGPSPEQRDVGDLDLLPGLGLVSSSAGSRR